MTEIPEHLLKRAQAARDKAAADAGAAAPASSDAPASDPRIPAHLLERSKAAKTRVEGDAGAVAVAEKVGALVAAAPSSGGIPVGAGPG